jgi:hypothetical protein
LYDGFRLVHILSIRDFGFSLFSPLWLHAAYDWMLARQRAKCVRWSLHHITFSHSFIQFSIFHSLRPPSLPPHLCASFSFLIHHTIMLCNLRSRNTSVSTAKSPLSNTITDTILSKPSASKSNHFTSSKANVNKSTKGVDATVPHPPSRVNQRINEL